MVGGWLLLYCLWMATQQMVMLEGGEKMESWMEVNNVYCNYEEGWEAGDYAALKQGNKWFKETVEEDLIYSSTWGLWWRQVVAYTHHRTTTPHTMVCAQKTFISPHSCFVNISQCNSQMFVIATIVMVKRKLVELVHQLTFIYIITNGGILWFLHAAYT